ncbi:hypothetical protein Bca4012_032876 [Brassica carinata]
MIDVLRRGGADVTVASVKNQGEFTTLILMRAFFTSSLSVKAYNFESHELVFPKLDETLTQAVCKFNGKSWKKIATEADVSSTSNSRIPPEQLEQNRKDGESDDPTLRSLLEYSGDCRSEMVVQQISRIVLPEKMTANSRPSSNASIRLQNKARQLRDSHKKRETFLNKEVVDKAIRFSKEKDAGGDADRKIYTII